MGVLFLWLQITDFFCSYCFGSKHSGREKQTGDPKKTGIELQFGPRARSKEREINLADLIENANAGNKLNKQAHMVSPVTQPKLKPKSSFHKCCPCCCCLPRNNRVLDCLGDTYFKYIKWYSFHFGEDSRNWFLLLSFRELAEITLQILAAFNYNGFNIFSKNQVVLGYGDTQVLLFCILLSLNCVFTGILWMLYIFCHNFCHGHFFKQLIFLVDTLFDTFYAIFPIIIVANQEKFNLKLAVAVLQTTNMYVLFLQFMNLCMIVTYVSFIHLC